MANDKNFKIKNGLFAGRYLNTNGTETALTNTYDVLNASYDSKSFNTGYSSSGDIVFKPDGTKMYHQTGTFNADSIYEYTLSTAWDISTASSTGQSFNLYAASFSSRSPQGLEISSDGTKLYSLDDDLNAIYQLDMSTAYDLSTVSYNSVAKTGLDTDGAASAKGFCIGSSGTKLYIVDAVDDLVYQYTLSTAWNISTASYDSITCDISGLSADPFPTSIRFNNAGTKFFILSTETDAIHLFSLSTAWDLSTASSDGTSWTITQPASPNTTGFNFGDSGEKFYIIDGSNNTYYQFSSVSRTQTLDLSTGDTFSFTPLPATTVVFNNPPASGTAIGFTLEINNTSYALTWPSSIKWHGGTAPAVTSTKEVYGFFTKDGGTTYYGKKAGENIS
jgi:hypothetical protein